jgi:NAD(P)H dehydrogenase (quinone)
MVTGSTGAFGTAVLEALISKGVRKDSLYAMARDIANVAHLKALGVNIVYGDYDDFDSLLGAFAGIDKLLFVSSTKSNNRSGQHRQVVKAAKRANVKYIVYTSQLHRTDRADSPIKFVVNSHLDTENAIKRSGMRYTILRNGLYLDLLPSFLGSKVIPEGIFLPAGIGRIAFALRSEMAEAAAAILAADGHRNKTYDLCGNGINFSEIALLLSQLTGHDIPYRSAVSERYIDLTVAKGLPRKVVLMMAGFCIAADQGELDGENSLLELLLGRIPTDVPTFLQEYYSGDTLTGNEKTGTGPI